MNGGWSLRGAGSDAAETELQADVMRFMAILALCLVAIFALVQSIPLTPTEAQPEPVAATPVPAPATTAPDPRAEPDPPDETPQPDLPDVQALYDLRENISYVDETEILQNGQTVEIITARGARPNPNWLTFVRTAKARTAIRQHMKNLRRTESIDLGKRLLDKSLKDLGSSLRKIGKVRMGEVLDELGLNKGEELFEQVGLGERLAPLTARLLLGADNEDQEKAKSASLVIAGTEGMVVSYAKCCYPLPGDDVMGYLTAGRGIVIHRNNCGNLSNFRKQPDKWIAVSWEKDIERDFHCQIQCETRNRTGVLAEVAATIADSGSNIEQVAVISRHEDVSVLTFLLQVHDRVHLAKILRNVRKMPSVIKVSRTIA